MHYFYFILHLLELCCLMATAATARFTMLATMTALVTTRTTACVANRVHFDDDDYTL